MAQAFLGAMGAHCTRYPIVPDDPSMIANALVVASKENDLVIISAGSSAGTRDFTADVISSLGDLLFHGVAVKPGKPVMLGRINGKPVLGLPGYPLAAQTMLREFAAPLLETWGLAPPHRHTVRVKLARDINSDLGFDEFVPVFVGRIGYECWGTPHIRGAGVQMATVKANAYAHIPAVLEGYVSGQELDVFLTTDPGSIDRTIILNGTLDPSIEELANLTHNRGLFVHGSNTGNIAALLALKRRSCHAITLSLPAAPFPAENLRLRQHIPEGGLVLVHIAAIEQGIASNDILALGDLTGVRWINTRKDSATRMIFDNLLQSRGIDSGEIDGYQHEVGGGSAVAEAVRNGFADAGMCTSGIAESHSLMFLPIATEHLELVFQHDMLGDPKITALVSVINSKEFRMFLESTGVYCTGMTGMARYLMTDMTLTDMPSNSRSNQ
jgi:putative molybdopterin biosynthesis protein